MTQVAVISEVELIAPEFLVPNPKNSAIHPPAQIAALAKSFEKFGFIGSIVVDADYMIIAGHGRVLAAIKAGMEEVPVIKADHLTDDEIREYMILDNQLATQKDVDLEILSREVADLSTRFDFSDFNFDISSLLAGLDNPGEGSERKDKTSSREEWDDDQDEPEGDGEYDSARSNQTQMDDGTLREQKEAVGSKEYSAEDFSEFDHKCPRCNFEFNGVTNGRAS